jgi:hypothetical protein
MEKLVIMKTNSVFFVLKLIKNTFLFMKLVIKNTNLSPAVVIFHSK